MTHSATHAGLQQHSIGEFYPWTVRVVGDSCQAFNCVTSDAGVLHPFDPSANPQATNSFEHAHQLAEAACGLKIVREVMGPALTPGPVVGLSEFRILIPFVRDDSKAPHTAEEKFCWEDFLLDQCGGFTHGDSVSGVWRDSAGAIVSDNSSVYYAAPRDSAAFLAAMPYWAKVFGQQCLYVVQTSNNAQLIYAK